MQCVKLRSVMGSYLNIHLNLFPIYVLLLLLTLSHGRPSAKVRETTKEDGLRSQRFHNWYHQLDNMHPHITPSTSNFNSVSNEYISSEVVSHNYNKNKDDDQQVSLGAEPSVVAAAPQRKETNRKEEATGSSSSQLGITTAQEAPAFSAAGLKKKTAPNSIHSDAEHGAHVSKIEKREAELSQLASNSIAEESPLPHHPLPETDGQQGSHSQQELGHFRQNILKSLGHSESSLELLAQANNTSLIHNRMDTLTKVREYKMISILINYSGRQSGMDLLINYKLVSSTNVPFRMNGLHGSVCLPLRYRRGSPSPSVSQKKLLETSRPKPNVGLLMLCSNIETEFSHETINELLCGSGFTMHVKWEGDI